MNKFNNWLGNKLADGLSTMNFFWFCLLLDIIGFIALIQQTIQAIHTHSSVMGILTLWVAFLAQAVIQLLALPLLAFQNKQQQNNHEETLSHIKKIHKKLGVK